MPKQIYIDSQGNEIPVSGTINTGVLLPMSGSDNTSIASAINSKQDIIPKGGVTSLDANTLYGDDMVRVYRSVGGTITNIPGVDGTLMVISNGGGYSTIQMYVNFDGRVYIRDNWAASSVSWTSWVEQIDSTHLIKDSSNYTLANMRTAGFYSGSFTDSPVSTSTYGFVLVTGLPNINNVFQLFVAQQWNGDFTIKTRTSSSASAWYSWRTLYATNCSVTKGSTMPTGFPTPQISRRGNNVVLTFGFQLPAGTYNNTDSLWVCAPKPFNTFRGNIAMGSLFPSVLIDTGGNFRFNGTQTLSSATWFIGQMNYLTDE